MTEDEPKSNEIIIIVPPVQDEDMDEDDKEDIRVEKAMKSQRGHVDRGGFRGT